MELMCKTIYCSPALGKMIVSLYATGFFLLLSLMSVTSSVAQVFDSLSYPFEMKRIALDEKTTIAYADEGRGEAVLFIHGLGSYAPSWKKNIQTLDKSFRCIVIDLAGYGKSSKDFYEADMSFHAGNLIRLMELLNVKSYNIAGHSMGAQIAVHMALQKPERIKKIALIAPAGIETFTNQEKQFFALVTPASLAATTPEQYRKNLEANFYQYPADAEFMFTDRMAFAKDKQFAQYCHVVSKGIEGMLRQPVKDQLQQIKQPVLILFGKNDALIPNRYMHPQLTTAIIAEQAKNAFSNAQLEMIDQAGHFVMFEQPDLVNAAILSFLKRKNNLSHPK